MNRLFYSISGIINLAITVAIMGAFSYIGQVFLGPWILDNAPWWKKQFLAKRDELRNKFEQTKRDAKKRKFEVVK